MINESVEYHPATTMYILSKSNPDDTRVINRIERRLCAVMFDGHIQKNATLKK